jgi:hypothetical protein
MASWRLGLRLCLPEYFPRLAIVMNTATRVISDLGSTPTTQEATTSSQTHERMDPDLLARTLHNDQLLFFRLPQELRDMIHELRVSDTITTTIFFGEEDIRTSVVEAETEEEDTDLPEESDPPDSPQDASPTMRLHRAHHLNHTYPAFDTTIQEILAYRQVCRRMYQEIHHMIWKRWDLDLTIDCRYTFDQYWQCVDLLDDSFLKNLYSMQLRWQRQPLCGTPKCSEHDAAPIAYRFWSEARMDLARGREEAWEWESGHIPNCTACQAKTRAFQRALRKAMKDVRGRALRKGDLKYMIYLILSSALPVYV